MTHVLHIDASASRAGSITRELSARIVEKLRPAKTTARDLADALPQIDADWVAANTTPANARTPEHTQRLALSDTLVAELKDTDVIVIGVPIYNFGGPASLKAWIDLVARAGLTFSYTADGPKGLLEGKRAILAVASGGTQVGSDIDFATGYLRHVLGFIGIHDVEIVAADRMAIDPEAARDAAFDAVEKLAA